MDEHLERQYLEVELYEKIIVRERRRKAILICLAFSLFLFLCGIPVYNERLPKWESLKAARKIAVEIERLKTESLHLKKPLQLSILDGGLLKVEQVSGCGIPSDELATAQELISEKKWARADGGVALLSEADAKRLHLNFTVRQICFDPVNGLSSSKTKKVIVLVPVKDLAESRLDRASYVELETSSARTTIN